MVGVRHANPPDVGLPPVGMVHSTEREPALGGVEPGQPLGVGRGEDLALDDRLGRSGAAVEQHLAKLVSGVVPQFVEPCVEGVDVGLLAGKLRIVRRRHRTFLPDDSGLVTVRRGASRIVTS